MWQYSFKTNPLKCLGYSIQEYGIFRKYLRIPKFYLRGILLRYPRDLNEVPLVLHELVEQADNAIWRRVKMSMTKEEMIKSVQYKIARIPPFYIPRNELPTTSGKNLTVYQQVIDNVKGFSSMGRVLYFHSGFEEQSLLAASNIIKAGINKGLKCCMLTLPQFMGEIKTFEDSKLLRGMEEADLCCLSMLGTAYVAQSGFTEATFCNFVDQRRIAGKSTLLSCHMTPAEFKERYGIDLARFGAVSMQFEDSNITTTIAQLGKELEALKGGK